MSAAAYALLVELESLPLSVHGLDARVPSFTVRAAIRFLLDRGWAMRGISRVTSRGDYRITDAGRAELARWRASGESVFGKLPGPGDSPPRGITADDIAAHEASLRARLAARVDSLPEAKVDWPAMTLAVFGEDVLEAARCIRCKRPLTNLDKGDLRSVADVERRTRMLRNFVCWRCLGVEEPEAVDSTEPAPPPTVGYTTLDGQRFEPALEGDQFLPLRATWNSPPSDERGNVLRGDGMLPAYRRPDGTVFVLVPESVEDIVTRQARIDAAREAERAERASLAALECAVTNVALSAKGLELVELAQNADVAETDDQGMPIEVVAISRASWDELQADLARFVAATEHFEATLRAREAAHG